MDPAPIYFWLSDGCAWAKVAGSGSHLNATALKDFAIDVTRRGFRTIVIDLGECPEVDSTFLGTCAFAALRLRELGTGEVRVTNVNSEVMKSLQNLGLDQLFRVELAD